MIRKKNGITIYNKGAQKIYNRAVDQFVEHHLLQTQAEGASGYQNSLDYSALPDGWKPWAAVRQVIEEERPVPEVQLGRFNVTGLGTYERTVLSAIAWGDLNTIIIAGERGSGKTALVKRLEDVLKDSSRKTCGLCERCESPVLVRIDFNHIGDYDDIAQIRKAFLIEMEEVLQAHLRPHLEKTSVMEGLIQYLRERQGEQIFSAFNRLIGSIDRDSESWRKKGDIEKVDTVYGYVESRPGGLRRRVELLMAVARYFRDVINRDSACFVLIVDNLDVILPEAQSDLLVTILALQRTARIRTVVPLRWSTFEQIRGQAAYSYGVIPHRGPGIRKVLEARLGYFLGKWSDLPSVKALIPEHREALHRRLEYIQRNIGRRLGDNLEWLSGRGVKLGLKIAARAIVNATVRYDQDPDNDEDMIRALFVGINRDQIMDPRDPTVLNVFSDPLTQRFTLLNLRVLQLVLEFRNSPPSRTVANLAKLILRTGLWGPDELAASLKEMSSTYRPLIFIDGSSRIDGSKEELESLHRVVFLTKAGEHYSKRIIREVSYFQEASICVRWPRDTLSSDLSYGTVIERFSIVRSCLLVLREQDYQETKTFREQVAGSRFSRDIDWVLYSSRITYASARAVLRILADRQDYSYLSTATLRDWLSLLLQTLQGEKELFGAENEWLLNLSKLIDNYETELGDWRRRAHSS